MNRLFTSFDTRLGLNFHVVFWTYYHTHTCHTSHVTRPHDNLMQRAKKKTQCEKNVFHYVTRFIFTEHTQSIKNVMFFFLYSSYLRLMHSAMSWQTVAFMRPRASHIIPSWLAIKITADKSISIENCVWWLLEWTRPEYQAHLFHFICVRNRQQLSWACVIAHALIRLFLIIVKHRITHSHAHTLTHSHAYIVVESHFERTRSINSINKQMWWK